MKLFLAFLQLWCLGLSASIVQAQTLPSHPEGSRSLEKVLCGIRERYDAVHKQQVGVLEAGKEKLAAEYYYVGVSSAWFVGGFTAAEDPEYPEMDYAAWSVLTASEWVFREVEGASARGDFAAALTAAIQHPGVGPTWGSLNIPYPPAGAADNLSPEEIDEIISEANNFLTYRLPDYVPTSVAVGQAVFLTGNQLLHFGRTREEYIRSLAARTDALTTFQALHLSCRDEHERESPLTEHATRPEIPAPLPLMGANDDETIKRYAFPSITSGISIHAQAGAYAFKSSKRNEETQEDEDVWYLRRSSSFNGYSLTCPGHVEGSVGVTVTAGNFWNDITNQAGPSVFGPVTGPCAETVWKVVPVTADQVVDLNSSTAGISSLFFDVSAESVAGSVEVTENTAFFVPEPSEKDSNLYPGEFGDGECQVRFLAQPTFYYRFPSNAYDEPKELLGNVSFDGHYLKLYVGRSASAGSQATHLQLDAYTGYNPGSNSPIPNLAHLRHWYVGSNGGGRQVIYSSREADLPESKWNINEWPGGDSFSGYSDWQNYGDYVSKRQIIRQILTRDALVDIVKVTSHKYVVNIYTAPVAPIQGAQTALYPVDGSPLLSLSIENPGNDFQSLGSVVINSGNMTYELARDQSNVTFNLKKAGVTFFQRVTELDQTDNTSTSQFVIDGKTSEKFEGRFDESLSLSAKGYLRLLDYTGETGYLKQDEIEYEYQAGPYGLPSLIRSGDYKMTRTLDSIDSTLITRVETRDEQIIARGWEVRPSLYEERYVTATDLGTSFPGSSSNLVTTVYRDNGSGSNPWAVKSIRHPDGTATVYEHEIDGENAYVTITLGNSANSLGEPTEILDGIGETYKYDKQTGAFLDYRSFDVATNTTLAHRFTFAQSIEAASFKQPTTIKSWDGSTFHFEYDDVTGICTGATDHLGKETTITPDALMRPATVTRDGLTTSFAYNQGGSFGTKITLPDGSDIESQRSDSGLTTSSKVSGPPQTGGVRDTFETKRQPDKTIKSTQHAVLGDRTVESVIGPDGVATKTGGDAAEPFDYTVTVEDIPDTSIKGIMTVATHKPGGAQSGLAFTTYTDGAGRLIRREDPAEDDVAVTRYNYEGARLMSVIDPDGVATLFDYNDRGELFKSGIDLNGSGELDAGDRVTEVATTYHSSGITTTTKFCGRVIETRIQRPQQKEVDILPDGVAARKTTISVTRTGATETIEAVSPLGESEAVYQDGRLMSREVNSGNITVTTDIARNALGQPTTITNSRPGPTSTVTLDPITGIPTSSTLGSRTFNINIGTHSGGGIVAGFSSAGETHSSLFDRRGYQLESTGNNQIDYTMSAPQFGNGKVEQTLTVGNHDTEFASSYGGDTTRTLPDESSVSSTYTKAGRLLTSTNARGETATYTRSNGVDIDHISYADDGSASLTWRPDGQIDYISDDAGNRDYEYDGFGRLQTITYQSGTLDGKVVTYSYDAQGRFAGVAVNTGDAVTYGYTEGQLTSVFNATAGRTASFSGDPMPNGIRKSMTYGPLTLNKVIHENGNIEEVNNSSSAAGSFNFSYTYDGRHRKDSVTLPNGRKWMLDYNTKGHLKEAIKKNGGATVAEFYYATNAFGNPTSRTVDSNVTTYTAGAPGLNQVAGKTNPDRSVSVVGKVAPITNKLFVNGADVPLDPDGTFEHTLGGLGSNGKWVPVTLSAIIYGGGDGGRNAIQQKGGYAWLPPLSEGISYGDDDGNRTRDSRFIYEWDSQNQLIAVTDRNRPPNNQPLMKVRFAYDSEGRRCSKSVLLDSVVQTNTSFIYDDWRLLYEECRDGNGAVILVRSYTWGPDLSGSLDGAGGIGGLLEVRETREGSTTRSIPLFDGMGNVTALIDASSGAKVATYEYGMFGELLSAQGTRRDACPLLFSTKYYDSEVGLSYFGYRYYDAETRSWISRDPLGEAGGVNLYAFCNNDPVNNMDPDGLSAIGKAIRWTFEGSLKRNTSKLVAESGGTLSLAAARELASKQLRDTYYQWAGRAISEAGLGKEYQLHHVILQSVFDDGGHISKWLGNIGVLKDEAANLVALPTRAAIKKGLVSEASIHFGRHMEEYLTKEVLAPLQVLAARPFSDVWTKDMARDAVLKLQQSIRKDLLSGKIKLQRYDTVSNRQQWIRSAFAGTMTILLAAGFSEAEAIEVAMQRTEKAIENEGYYREQNAYIRYGTAGYYASESGGFLGGAAFVLDLINPIEDIMIIGDLSADAGDVWGEYLSGK